MRREYIKLGERLASSILVSVFFFSVHQRHLGKCNKCKVDRKLCTRQGKGKVL
jgi:hypothetical protein